MRPRVIPLISLCLAALVTCAHRGEIVTPPVGQKYPVPCKGTAWNGWGYCDEQGAVIIPQVYERAHPFSEGLGLVRISRCEEYAKEGKEMTSCASYDGFCFINARGEIVIDLRPPFPGYEQVRPFRCGRAPFCDSVFGGCGYIDTSGKVVIRAKYNEVSSFSNGVALVSSLEEPAMNTVKGCLNLPWEVTQSCGEICLGGISFGYYNLRKKDMFEREKSRKIYRLINPGGKVLAEGTSKEELIFIDPAGTAILHDGSKYAGELKAGRLEGRGTLTSSDGSVYTGEFRNGKRHGRGTSTSSSGEKYVGQWENDWRQGQGTLYHPDGSVKQKGIWSGNTYSGACAGNCANGQGTLTYPDRSVYTGQFRDGRRHGQGTSLSHNGEKYVGAWEDDVKHGRGTLYHPNGSIKHQGSWAGDMFQGNCIGNCEDGKGTMTWPEGHVYSGEWRYKMPHGQGIMIDPEGKRKEGRWYKGEYQGK